VQWMTAGRGVVHGEMFPLIHTDKPNTLRLIQIWLNLPKASKMARPACRMVSGSQNTCLVIACLTVCFLDVETFQALDRGDP
jgi:redox-sensitive bicupin YhaK (pirin superfamily)